MKGGTFIVVGGLVLAGVAGYIVYKQLTGTKNRDVYETGKICKTD